MLEEGWKVWNQEDTAAAADTAAFRYPPRCRHQIKSRAALPMYSHSLDPFPALYSRGDAVWPNRLAAFALVIFPLTTLAARDFADGALYLLAIATIAAWRPFRAGDRHWWVAVGALLFGAFMAASNLAASARDPTLAEDAWGLTERPCLLFAFVLTGWWLGGSVRSASRFLALAYVGLLLEVAKNAGPTDWAGLLSWQRIDLGFINAQHTAVFFGSALIAQVTLWRWWWYPGAHGHWRLAQRVLGVATLGVSITVVLAVQTRQVWMGLAIAGIVAVVFLATSSRRSALERRRVLLAGATAIITLIACVAVVIAYSDGFRRKVAEDLNAVAAFVDSGGETAPDSSATIRLHHWNLALGLIAERPLLGHGAAAKEALIANSHMPEYARRGFGHLHNSYLELGVAFGVPGLLGFIALLTLLAWRTIVAWRFGTLPVEAALFGVAWLAFFAVVNLFESYVIQRTGYLVLAVCGGVLYSLTMTANRPRGTAS